MYWYDFGFRDLGHERESMISMMSTTKQKGQYIGVVWERRETRGRGSYGKKR